MKVSRNASAVSDAPSHHVTNLPALFSWGASDTALAFVGTDGAEQWHQFRLAEVRRGMLNSAIFDVGSERSLVSAIAGFEKSM